MTVALITGITGQDGSYLSEFLFSKHYKIYGIQRRASSFNTSRIEHLRSLTGFELRYGDVTDFVSVTSIISEIIANENITVENPLEIYNLAAQSHVKVSFEIPLYTANCDAIGCLNILESIRTLGITNRCRFYQASTSEMFGSSPPPQNENTPLSPQSPYGVAKVYAYWICKNYRQSYNMYICNGILFNHESPRRGKTFVTKKITDAVKRIGSGRHEVLELGNLNSRRDWGHARDYVESMWIMLQQPLADDYVVSMGESHTVREFVNKAFLTIGVTITWQGEGENEKGFDNDGNIVIAINPKFFRPCEVNYLEGDSTKIHSIGWKPKYTLDTLIEEMITSEDI